MRSPILVIILFLFTLYASGQVYIKGKITDGAQVLQYVTAQLLRPDSAILKEVMTDPTGEFRFDNIPAGNYLVSSTAVGYSKYVSSVINAQGNIILPDIILQTAATNLNEVVVKAKKPLYEQQIDRLVVNVQSSITSTGSTVLEVLEKSPGVVVNKQSNTIGMNGKSGVRVMINGKVLQVPLEVAMQTLDGISASNVEKIELIHTPPAKYDAEGNGGIIHIVMKGNPDIGTTGSLSLTLGRKWAETSGGNFTLAHRSRNFAWTFDYAIQREHNQHTSEMRNYAIGKEFVQFNTNFSERENITITQNLSAGFEWKLSKNTVFNTLITGYRRNWKLDAITNDNNIAAKDSTIVTNMKIHEINLWQSATAGVGLQTKVNPKTDLSFNVDYLFYHNNNPSDYDNKIFYKQQNVRDNEKIGLKKRTPIGILTGRVDYQYRYSPMLTWEAGIKAVTSNLDNDVSVQRFKNGAWVDDPEFTSFSTLNEETGAAYLSTKWNAGKKWQIDGGLRYEYTHTALGTPLQKNLIDRKYGKLFPSIFIRKDFGNDQHAEFAYSRRITRPTYNDLAPFVFFWSPGTFSTGNTSLYPSIADAVKLGYHTGRWILSLEFTHSRREIHFLQPERDTVTGNVVYRSQNLAYLNTLAFTSSWSFKPAPWWEVQSNLLGRYQAVKTTHLKHNLTLDLYGVNVNVVNSVTLPKDFSVEVSGFYQSKSFFGISQYAAIGSLNAGIQKKMGEKGSFRLAMDDILHTNYWKLKTYMPENNLDAYFMYDFHVRYIRLTYTRKLGNLKLRSVKLKSGSEEERQRVGN